jgi:hypothetical protein
VGLVFEVFGLDVVRGTDVTVTVGGAVLVVLVDGLDELEEVTDPVGSSSGLTARRSAVADVAAATGASPPPGVVVHAATPASPATAIARANARVGRGREIRTTRTGACRGTSGSSRLLRTVLVSTCGADVNDDSRDIQPTGIRPTCIYARVLERLKLRAQSTPLFSDGWRKAHRKAKGGNRSAVGGLLAVG